ncbi:MAG TPA: GNAT family N-acetyltransferase [Dehalococcoidia bacterium]|nr:GNAT family N-acetyltransferase [Dehalococcoidia bacterium]
MQNDNEMSNLQVRWFDEWHPELDEALRLLPEMETCPHELFRMLMVNRTSNRKRTALVTARGEPLAVVGLRQKRHHWELVPPDASPEAFLPAAPEAFYPTLAALGVDLWVWGLAEGAPPPGVARFAQAEPTYKVDCQADYEEHWRETGHIRVVRSARERTQGYRLEIDAPGAAEWTIRNWAAKWAARGSDTLSRAEDQIVAASYLQPRGQLHTFRLFDDDEPVAGATLVVAGAELIGMSIYSSDAYRKQAVGTRLMDAIFAWAREAGYRKVELGTGDGYKAGIAPADGCRWTLNFCPGPAYAFKRTVRWMASPLATARMRIAAIAPARIRVQQEAG